MEGREVRTSQPSGANILTDSVTQVQGGGGAEETEGEAGREEGDQSRAGEEGC